MSEVYDFGDGTVEVMVNNKPTTIKRSSIWYLKNVGRALLSDSEILDLYRERILSKQLDNWSKEESHA